MRVFMLVALGGAWYGPLTASLTVGGGAALVTPLAAGTLGPPPTSWRAAPPPHPAAPPLSAPRAAWAVAALRGGAGRHRIQRMPHAHPCPREGAEPTGAHRPSAQVCRAARWGERTPLLPLLERARGRHYSAADDELDGHCDRRLACGGFRIHLWRHVPDGRICGLACVCCSPGARAAATRGARDPSSRTSCLWAAHA